jgi:hypothetical protein
MTEFLFYVNTLLSCIAIMFVFMGAAHAHIFREDPIIKFGAAVACFGLLGQLFRNVQFLTSGISPPDSEFPLWMLKDLGIFLMLLGYAMRGSVKTKR